MILIIDNYDSFTYNLVDYIGKQYDGDVVVYRNDKITLEEISALSPERIVISPGPKTPSQAGISKDVIKTFGDTIPILGVCLGHQAIGEVFGATVCGAKHLMHGKTSLIDRKDHPLFKGLENPFVATRYHSLVLKENTIPNELDIIAYAKDDKEVMAIAHKQKPIYGVQFHPESICTKQGLTLINNFLNL